MTDCFLAVVVVLIVGPIAVYLSVRLGAAAYFRSKRDHEDSNYQPPRK